MQSVAIAKKTNIVVVVMYLSYIAQIKFSVLISTKIRERDITD